MQSLDQWCVKNHFIIYCGERDHFEAREIRQARPETEKERERAVRGREWEGTLTNMDYKTSYESDFSVQKCQADGISELDMLQYFVILWVSSMLSNTILLNRMEINRSAECYFFCWKKSSMRSHGKLHKLQNEPEIATRRHSSLSFSLSLSRHQLNKLNAIQSY